MSVIAEAANALQVDPYMVVSIVDNRKQRRRMLGKRQMSICMSSPKLSMLCRWTRPVHGGQHHGQPQAAHMHAQQEQGVQMIVIAEALNALQVDPYMVVSIMDNRKQRTRMLSNNQKPRSGSLLKVSMLCRWTRTW